MENAVVGSGGRLHGLLNKQRLIIAAMVLVVLIAGGLITWHVMSRPKPNPDVTAALNAAQSAYNKGDFNTTLATLRGEDGKTNYKPQKVQIYDLLANASAARGKLQDALHYYDLKHQLDPGSAQKDANVMGSIYERQHDTQKAIEQYTIALNYYKSLPNANQLHMDIETLQGQIDALKGQGK